MDAAAVGKFCKSEYISFFNNSIISADTSDFGSMYFGLQFDYIAILFPSKMNSSPVHWMIESFLQR